LTLLLSSLALRDGDDPDAVAVAFVSEQGLPVAVVGPLAQRLREALASNTAVSAGRRPATQTGHRRSSVAESSGERMYRAALEARQRKEQLAAAEQQRREEAALAGLQPGPVITSRARRLQRQEPAWKRLNALASSSLAAREQLSNYLRAAEEQAELAECTFAPATTSQSASLMAHRQAAMRQAGVTSHDTLYADAQRRAARDEELRRWMPQEATFRPAVLPTAHVPAGAPGDVVERLVQAGQAAKQHQVAAASAARLVDPSSGRRMFVPQTGRPASDSARQQSKGGSVHEHLYSLRDEYARHKQELAAQSAAQMDAQRAGASQRSAALAESRRMRRFAQIFRALDRNREGVISPWAAAADALARLHPEIAGDVQLAAALNGQSDTVDEDSFCALMEAAIRVSNSGPRGYLGASAGRSSSDSASSHRFAPKLNDVSRRMAARRRPANVPVYEALAQEQRKTQDKVRLLASEMEMSEMAECTFRPMTATRGGGTNPGAASMPVTLSHIARLPPVPHGAELHRLPARFERDLELRLNDLSLRANT